MSPALGTDPLRNSLFKPTQEPAPEGAAGPPAQVGARLSVPAVAAAQRPPLRVVAFRVGDSLFVADMAQVSTIVRMVEVVPVAMTPPFVEGIVNVRGTVVPVLSLGRLLGVKPRDHILRQRIIVGGSASEQIGLIVDAVSNLYTLEADKIQPVSETTPMAQFAQGIARIEQVDTTLLAVILDMGKLIDFQKRSVSGQKLLGPAGDQALGDIWSKGIKTFEPETEEAENVKQVLCERAKALSVPLVQVRRETRQVLTFALGSETYGLSTGSAARILKPLALTKLPSPPRYVLGVVNFEGEVLPIIDLGTILGLVEERQGKPYIVVAEHKGIRIGFYADAVFHVLDIAVEDIEPPLSTIEKVRGEYIDGEVRLDGQLIVLLNWPSIMASSEMQKSTGVAEAQKGVYPSLHQ